MPGAAFGAGKGMVYGGRDEWGVIVTSYGGYTLCYFVLSQTKGDQHDRNVPMSLVVAPKLCERFKDGCCQSFQPKMAWDKIQC